MNKFVAESKKKPNQKDRKGLITLSSKVPPSQHMRLSLIFSYSIIKV